MHPQLGSKSTRRSVVAVAHRRRRRIGRHTSSRSRSSRSVRCCQAGRTGSFRSDTSYDPRGKRSAEPRGDRLRPGARGDHTGRCVACTGVSRPRRRWQPGRHSTRRSQNYAEPITTLVQELDAPCTVCFQCTSTYRRRTRNPRCCSCACTTPAGRRWRPRGCATWRVTGSTVCSGGSEPAVTDQPGRGRGDGGGRHRHRAEFPKPWTDEIVRAADVVVTMGCGDACPLYPGQAVRGLGARRSCRAGRRRRAPIRDEIRRSKSTRRFSSS